MHDQQSADRRPNGPANIEKGVVKGKNLRLLFRRQHVGKPRFQHGREDGVSAVNQREEKHHQRDAIDQRNSDKAANKRQHGERHIALFVELIGENAKTHAEQHPDDQRARQRVADFIHLQLVLAGEVDRHKR